LLVAEKQKNTRSVEREWKAKLSLGFTYKNNKTVLSERKHYGPLVVQRPFYPEGNDLCHVYLIHPPGGVVGGDKLDLNINLEKQTQVLITTPSAGKFYRSGDFKGSQTQKMTVAKESILEWFPQETIFFNGCNSELETEIKLTSDALFCGWEINCLGRPASGEKYQQGKIIQKLSLYRDNKPIFLERNEIEGASELLSSAGGFNDCCVFGTMLATQIDKNLCDELQNHWHEKKEKNVSLTLIKDVLVVRYLGDSAEQAKKYFSEIWSSVRMKQRNLQACAPRIWST